MREAGAEGEGAATRGRLEKEAAAGGEGEGEAPRRHFVEHLASSARSPWARAAAMLGACGSVGGVGTGEWGVRIVCVSVRLAGFETSNSSHRCPSVPGEFLYIFFLIFQK